MTESKAKTEKKSPTSLQICLLVFLSLFFPPFGILYAAWLISGKKGLCWGCGCLCLPLLLIAVWLWAINTSETGERVKHVDWLKEDASEISYYRSYQWTAYEYKTSEENFRKHANPYWKFQEIKEPVSVPRYLLMTKYKGNLFGGIPHESEAVIKNGIIATERRENGGGYIAVYDRDNGKAYIQHNPR